MDECKPLVSGGLARRPRAVGDGDARGNAVQVHPMRVTLKAHGTKRLKLNFDILLSNFVLKFNLRRYTEEEAAFWASVLAIRGEVNKGIEAWAYTRPLLSSS